MSTADNKLAEQVRGLGGGMTTVGDILLAFPDVINSVRPTAKSAVKARADFDSARDALTERCVVEKIPYNALTDAGALSKYGTAALELFDERVQVDQLGVQATRTAEQLRVEVSAALDNADGRIAVADVIAGTAEELMAYAEKVEAFAEHIVNLERLLSVSTDLAQTVRMSGAGNSVRNGNRLPATELAQRGMKIAAAIGESS